MQSYFKKVTKSPSLEVIKDNTEILIPLDGYVELPTDRALVWITLLFIFSLF